MMKKTLFLSLLCLFLLAFSGGVLADAAVYDLSLIHISEPTRPY